MGASLYTPLWLSYLTRAYAELGKFDDAARCISKAMTAVTTTGETWCEAEVNRIAGEIALRLPEGDAAKAEAHFERALAIARQQQAIGQGAASARTARSGLRLVHRGV
jgi:predicted ATPase